MSTAHYPSLTTLRLVRIRLTTLQPAYIPTAYRSHKDGSELHTHKKVFGIFPTGGVWMARPVTDAFGKWCFCVLSTFLIHQYVSPTIALYIHDCDDILMLSVTEKDHLRTIAWRSSSVSITSNQYHPR